MTVEELILLIASKVEFSDISKANNLKFDNPWDKKFILDIAEKLYENKALSVNQATIALKIIDKCRIIITTFSDLNDQDLNTILLNPVYENELWISQKIPREVRYLGSNLLGFKSNYNPSLREKIKKLKTYSPYPDPYPFWNEKYSLWIVAVNSSNLDRVMNFISQFNFHYDDETAELIREVENHKNQISTITIEEDKIKISIPDDFILNSFVIDYLKTLENQVE